MLLEVEWGGDQLGTEGAAVVLLRGFVPAMSVFYLLSLVWLPRGQGSKMILWAYK